MMWLQRTIISMHEYCIHADRNVNMRQHKSLLAGNQDNNIFTLKIES
jgi:hypothetical protein|tara:strand:+ start:19122 stop:19262 length:141 start_codon:yes stop_codon:yes gene_type:complete